MVTKNSNWLYEEHGHNMTSQHGEDGVIEKIFQIIKPMNKFCVEFGAMNGIIWSNTYNLIMNHDWQSVQIEMRLDFFNDLVKTYATKPVTCLHTNITPNNLDEVLTQNNVPQNLDLMSIDVDGIDYEIFESMKLFRPQVVLIECDPARISLASVAVLANEKGYELVAVTGVNAILVQKEIYHWFGIKSNAVENYKVWTESRQFKFGLELL
jgi:hypothetical protein